MRWPRIGAILVAVALIMVTQGCFDCCSDEVARTQIQQVRTYIGHEDPNGTRTGLVAWLDTVAIAVCALEKTAVGLPNNTRLCPQNDDGSDGQPNPPPPPPWGGE